MSTWALTIAGIQDGEWWRLWTAHATHYSWRHAVLDAMAAAPAIILMPPWLRRVVPLWLLLVAPLLSAALLGHPGLLEYRGCSGLVAGLWALVGTVLVCSGTSDNRRWGGILLTLLVTKSASEALSVAPIWQEDGWQALPLAHWLGAALGFVSGLLASTLPPSLQRMWPPGMSRHS